MRAMFIDPIDQSVCEPEMMRLEKLYIDIVENHGVVEISRQTCDRESVMKENENARCFDHVTSFEQL